MQSNSTYCITKLYNNAIQKIAILQYKIKWNKKGLYNNAIQKIAILQYKIK